MTDHLSTLREHDERLRQKREAARLQSEAKKARDDEYREAWNALHHELAIGDGDKDHFPQFEVFVHLVKVLQEHEQYDCLPEIASFLAGVLDDIAYYRPAQLFVVQLLLSAGKLNATANQFRLDYLSFVPSRPPQQTWRAQGAQDVRELVQFKASETAQIKAKKEAEQLEQQAKARADSLRAAAARKPAIEKQLFAVHWTEQGKRPAFIRDKWNELHAKDRIEGGDPGRDDIKKAVIRGREFLADNSATVAEMVAIVGFRLG